MKGLYSFAAVAASFVATAAAAQVTPTNLQGWTPANVRPGGSVAITDTYKPAGQGGSLEFNSNGSGAKADFANVWGLQSGRTLGSLSSLSYAFLRDSSSTSAGHLAPAFRLSYYDQASDKSGYLVYEPVYNGYPTAGAGVPTNVFTTIDMTNANFWMRTFGPGVTIENYGLTLSDYARGVDADGAANNAHILSAATYIYGIEVGVGSGWEGTFKGAVDNVSVAFGRDVVTANFEPAATAAVPEPATWALMLIGFGAVGYTLRSAKRRGEAALAA